MRKKSQIAGQIFIYLLGIVLTGAMLLYGYKAIQGFGERTSQAAFIKFEADLSTEIKTSMEFGSVSRETFLLSEDFGEVCFLDLNAFNYQDIDRYPLIKNSLESGVKKNVFMITGSQNVHSSFYAGNIEAIQGFICLPVANGRLNVEFEGKGKSTMIRGYR